MAIFRKTRCLGSWYAKQPDWFSSILFYFVFLLIFSCSHRLVMVKRRWWKKKADANQLVGPRHMKKHRYFNPKGGRTRRLLASPRLILRLCVGHFLVFFREMLLVVFQIFFKSLKEANVFHGVIFLRLTSIWIWTRRLLLLLLLLVLFQSTTNRPTETEGQQVTVTVVSTCWRAPTIPDKEFAERKENETSFQLHALPVAVDACFNIHR